MSRFSIGLLLLLALPLLAPTDAPEALLVVAADQHSAYELTAQVVAAVDQLKAKHPGLPLAILLDGDSLENSNVVARRSRGAVDFAMFSALAKRAPTIVNLGNHETEFYDLADTVARIEATGAQVVTNLTNRDTGHAAAPPAVRLTLGAYETVVIGVATDDVSTYRDAVRPSLGVTDSVTWAKANFPALLGDAPVRVVLSHAGLKADRGMLPLVPDGTLFAGAHDHLRFVQPFAHTAYFHSGSWNAFMTLAWLHHDTSGAPRWDVRADSGLERAARRSASGCADSRDSGQVSCACGPRIRRARAKGARTSRGRAGGGIVRQRQPERPWVSARWKLRPCWW